MAEHVNSVVWFFAGVGALVLLLRVVGAPRRARVADPSMPTTDSAGEPALRCVCPARLVPCECAVNGKRNPRGYGTRAGRKS